MAEKIVQTFRIDPKCKAQLQALADKNRCTVTDVINDGLKTLVPLPSVVRDGLKSLADGSGIHPVEILNLTFVDYMARAFVAQQKFGQLLSNPFWKVGTGGFLEDHDELYWWLKTRYEKAMNSILESKK